MARSVLLAHVNKNKYNMTEMISLEREATAGFFHSRVLSVRTTRTFSTLYTLYTELTVTKNVLLLKENHGKFPFFLHERLRAIKRTIHSDC